MKPRNIIFIAAFFIALGTFQAFTTIESKSIVEQIAEAEQLSENQEQFYEFLKYIISTLSGLLALALRWLIKRRYPDFDAGKNKKF